MIDELKEEIERVFGKKINNRGDCEQLSDEIFLMTKENLNYNTLRRFFGLAASTKPRRVTLDILSKFVGYNSFAAFRKEFNTLDYWDEWEHIFRLLTEKQFDEVISSLRIERRKGKDFDSLVVTVCREFVLQNNYEALRKLFSENWMSVSDSNYSSRVYLGNVLGPLLANQQLSDELLLSLLSIKNYRYSVYGIFVDYGLINGFLGRQIDIAIKYPNILDSEMKRFTQALYLLKEIWQKGFSIAMEKFDPKLTPQLSDHPILFGRIIGLHMIFHVNNHIKRNQLKLQLLEAIAKNPNQTIDYFYELIVLCLFFNDIWVLNLINECIKKESTHTGVGVFWYQNRNYMYIKFIKAIQCMHNGNRNKAKQLLQGFFFEKIRTSNLIFIEFYYYIILYHLSTTKKEKEHYMKSINKIGQTLPFVGLTNDYVINYFSVSFNSPYNT